jgi:hypothetical protein
MLSPHHDEAVNYDYNFDEGAYCPTPPRAYAPTSPGDDPPPGTPSPLPPPPLARAQKKSTAAAARLTPYAAAASAAPKQDDGPPRRLYIGGIDRIGPFRQAVRLIAEKYGPLSRAVFIGHQPFAIVTFASGRDARRCMRELHHRSHPELTRGQGQLDVQPLRESQTRPDVLPTRPQQQQQQRQQHVLRPEVRYQYPVVTSTSTTPVLLPPSESAHRRGGRKRQRSPGTSRHTQQQQQQQQQVLPRDSRLRTPSPAHKRQARRPSPHRIAFATVELRGVARDVTHEELRADLRCFGPMAFPPVLEPEGGVARIYFHDVRAAQAATQFLHGQMGSLSERKQCLQARIL